MPNILEHYKQVNKDIVSFGKNKTLKWKEDNKMAQTKGLPEPRKVSGIGQKQAGRVMKEFYGGKLRSKSGEKVTSPEQAKAIAMSEGRAAMKRGITERTWKGKTRIRPKLEK